MTCGTPTTEAQLAAYLRRQGLAPVPGSEPRLTPPPGHAHHLALDTIARTVQQVLGSAPCITLILPVTVSVNHLYTQAGTRRVLTTAGRQCRRLIIETYQRQYGTLAPLQGALRGTLELYPPDRRRRDVPNLEKLISDALERAGAYADDSQFTEWHQYKREVTQPGYIRVTVQQLVHQEEVVCT